MKTTIKIVLVAFVSTLILASCGAGRKASCDAYGSIQQIENNDLASK
jgi:hypothetical protein